MSGIKNLQRKLNRSVRHDRNYGTKQLIDRALLAKQKLRLIEDREQPISATEYARLKREADLNVMKRRDQRLDEEYRTFKRSMWKLLKIRLPATREQYEWRYKHRR